MATFVELWIRQQLLNLTHLETKFQQFGPKPFVFKEVL